MKQQNPFESSSESGDGSDSSEWSVVAWGAGWFFFVLLSYSVVRPIRETMGSIGGTKQLQGLMLVTFLVMLLAVPAYSALVSRFSRRWLVRVVFHFFCVSLLGFSAGLAFGTDLVRVWTARVFFIWVNVYGLFATSVFWSVLTDLFSSEQGKRLFGRIAAGGTIGAITGSFLTSQIATSISTSALLLVPVVTIQLGLGCAWRLEKGVAAHPNFGGRNRAGQKLQSGGLLEGITRVLSSPYLASICVFLFFVQASGTLLYLQQAEIVRSQVVDDQQKTQFFAYVDFATQTLTFLGQVFLSSWLLRRFGVAAALLVLPVVYCVGFAALAQSQTLIAIAVCVVAARASAYGITVPAREVLFTVVDREDRYKSKSFIDTVVLRGGDAIAGQVFGTLHNIAGFAFSAINLGTLPLMAVWGFAAFRLGRRQKRLAESAPHDRAEPEPRSGDAPESAAR
ncbi:MAG: MFS transporter [Planctomycetota bacterium]